jgi:hypothetical protein
LIYHLVKERGFTLLGAKEKLRKGKNSTKKEVSVVESLENIKLFLQNLKKEL